MKALLPIVAIVAALVPLVLAWLLSRVAGARRIALGLLILGSAYIIDVNLLMHADYRGMSRSFDVGTTDILGMSLVLYLFGQVGVRGLVWRAPAKPTAVTPVMLMPPGFLSLLLFITVAALSILGSREPLYGFMDLFKLVRGLAVFWVSANLVADDRSARDLPFFLLIFVGVEMTVGAYQHLTGVWWVHGTFEHKNSFAMSMNLVLPVMLAEALRARGWRASILLGYGAGAVGLILSRSRFGWATMGLAALIVTSLCLILTFVKRDRSLLQRQAAVLALAGFLAIPAIAKSYDSIVTRWGEDAEVSMDFRHRNNEIAKTLAAEHPFGVGLNNYVKELEQPIGRLLDPIDRTVAHHLYNLVAAETGILGVLSLVWAMLTFVVIALRTLVQSVKPWSQTIAIGLGAGLVSAMMHSFGESDLLRRETYFIFCMLMGFLSAVHSREGLGGRSLMMRLLGESMRATRRTGLVVIALIVLAAPLARAASATVTPLSARHLRVSFAARIEPTQIPPAPTFKIEGAPSRVIDVGLHAVPVGKVEDPWPPKAIMRYDLLLVLDKPLPEGKEVKLITPSWLLTGPLPVRFSSLDPSPSIKLPQVGFLPDDPNKAVFVGMYLGSLGPMKVQVGAFDVIDLSNSKVVLRGKATRIAENDQVYREDVWRLPLGELKEPGHYAVHVPGVGRSLDFRIAADVYDAPMTAVLRAFYHHRCGVPIEAKYTRFSRPACHPAEQVACFAPEMAETPLYDGEKAGSCRDATGGWHDASDYGKYVPTATVAVHNLMVAYQAFPEAFPDGREGIPESGNGISDLLDEAAVELDWLLKMQREDGGVYHKVTSRQWGTDKPPEKDRKTFYYSERTTADTARVAAVMAEAARVYAKVMPEAAARYRASAERAWTFLRAHPKPVPDPGFSQREWNGGGEYADRFGDDDERAWAAAEWIALTGDGADYDAFIVDKVPTPYNPRVPPLYVRDWPPPFEDAWRFALHRYATLKHPQRNAKLQAAIRDAWRVRTDGIEEADQEDPYGMAFRPRPGVPFGYGTSNGLRYAMDMSLGNMLLGQTPRRREAALSNLGALFGNNGPGFSFVTGIGARAVRQPEYRPDLYDGIDEPLPGHSVDGPALGVHSSNRDADQKLWPPPEDYPPGQYYFDMMDPVMSEPTVLEMSEAVIAFAPFATAKTSPEGSPR